MKEKDYDYMSLSIARESLEKTFGIKTELLPHLHFKDCLDGIEKINNKEYKLHIKTGNNYLFLINGSILITRSNGKGAPLINDIEIYEPSEALTKIPLLKFDKGYGAGITYFIPEYFKLTTHDVIKIEFKDEIENPEFIFLNVLRTI